MNVRNCAWAMSAINGNRPPRRAKSTADWHRTRERRNDMPHFGVRYGLQQSLRQANLVQDVEDSRVDGVAAKVAIEIGMRFKQRGRDALAREQECQEHTR